MLNSNFIILLFFTVFLSDRCSLVKYKSLSKILSIKNLNSTVLIKCYIIFFVLYDYCGCFLCFKSILFFLQCVDMWKRSSCQLTVPSEIDVSISLYL